jgi:hypothetical protein
MDQCYLELLVLAWLGEITIGIWEDQLPLVFDSVAYTWPIREVVTDAIPTSLPY